MKQYYSIDELDKQTNISKSQLIALAKQRKVRLSIDCAEVKGVFFSFDGNEIIGHGEGLYNGKLLLTEEDSFLLATRKSIRVYSAQIEEPDLAVINQFQYEPKSFELFNHWNPVSQLNESLVNGMFINTSISHDTDSNLKLGMKKLELERENGGMLRPIGITPFDNSLGTTRDVYVEGEEFSILQSMIGANELRKLTTGQNQNQPQSKSIEQLDSEDFKDEIDRVLGRIIVTNRNPKFLDAWRILMKDIRSEERVYDMNYIVRDISHTDISFINNYNSGKDLTQSTMRNRYTKVRNHLFQNN